MLEDISKTIPEGSPDGTVYVEPEPEAETPPTVTLPEFTETVYEPGLVFAMLYDLGAMAGLSLII